MNAEEILQAVLDKRTPAERAAYLDGACGSNVELRTLVEGLLKAHDEAGSFLEQPLFDGDGTLNLPTASEQPGTMIGPYKLLQQIGEGGMGTVWMAQQSEPIKRLVAIKLIKPGMDSKQVLARFDAERQALALMDHPNIARVFDAGTTVEPAAQARDAIQSSLACAAGSQRPYFVMELVKGVPITKYCDEHHLTPRQRLELFIPVCQAIQHAHQKGMIHRDIKPSNVLVAMYDDRPVPKVIDFGVAKATGVQLTEETQHTGFGAVVGTIEYMSPEQASFNQLDVDTRSDIYSLGVLLYELLAGSTPFTKKDLEKAGMMEMLRMIREQEPSKPSTKLSSSDALPSLSANRGTEPSRLTKLVRGELDWIVMKCLEKDRNRRYETANGLARDVEHYLADEPVQACPPSVAYRFRKFARRNKAGLAVVGLVLFFLILLGGSIGWVLRDHQARREVMAQQVRASMTQARKWVGENKLALARQELAAAKRQMGSAGPVLGGLAAEVEAYEAEVGQLESFLDLVDQAHEAEFPQAAAIQQASNSERAPAQAVPFLLRALSCYGILDHDDWSTLLEGGLLPPEQVARVRRMAYEELLWLADDVTRRWVDHRSGRKLTAQEAAGECLAYLRQAEAAARPTSAFYQIRARFLEALGRQGEARQDEELARRTPATIALDHYLLAGAAHAAGNKAEAVQQYEAALRVEPTHYWSLLGLGICLNHLGQQERDFAVAASAFTGCILKRPDHASPYAGRANAYIRLQRPKEAETDCREALRLRADFAWVHNTLGVALERQGKHAEAEAEYREALRLGADFPVAHHNLGLALYGKGRLDEAIAEFQAAVRLKKDFAEAHSNLGLALKDKGRLDEAIAEFQEALGSKQDFPEAYKAHYNLGNALRENGRLEEANAEFRESLRLQKDCAQAHINLGQALRALGKDAESVAEYREALRLRPDIPDAHLLHANLGISLERQGKHAEAVAEYREALRLRPDIPDAHRFHTSLGNALAKQGKHAEAEAEYRQTLRLRPDDPWAHLSHHNLANALAAQGKDAEAEAEYRQALRLRPGDPSAINLLGLFLCRQKPAAAARFYAETFAAEPKLADDLRFWSRYNAARAAAQAGCGQGQDAGKLDDKERARLRKQALDWLRADLAAWGQLLEKQPDQARARVQQGLRMWQQTADFAGVRGDALAKLPEAERQAWQQLWADVEQTLRRVDHSDSKDTQKKSPEG